MCARVTLSRHGDIAIISIDNPPVNAISPAVVMGLARAVTSFKADPRARVLLIHCTGRTFVAGGDIASFDNANFSAKPYNSVLAQIEAFDRPVVVVLHGTALGGGVELALACHYRVCIPGTRLGMPEVELGLLPGSLGTQRLPRLVGIEPALSLISSGRLVDADTALAMGLVDAIHHGEPLQVGIDYASFLLSQCAPARRLSEHTVGLDSIPSDFFSVAVDQAISRRGAEPAAVAIIKAVQASSLPFAEGAAIEATLFEDLRNSSQSRALRHLFFAKRQAARIPGLPAGVDARPVASVGVVGAGTMGGGIAISFASVGISVVLVDKSADALARGIAAIQRNYEGSVRKGRITTEHMERCVALIHGTQDDMALARCDLVVEAVFENMALKKQVCERLGRICKPGAIIATNTSTLDVDVLANATGRPADVVGMHFFSPANVMRLLEVVRGAQTAPDTLATAMQLARKIDKIAVMSGVCYGFIGNRMAEVYMREAEFLLMEGASPKKIDGAVEALGMAMGPCRMLDMAGIDVGAKTLIEYGNSGGLPADPSYRAMVRKMFELGRHGQKTGAGYYRYECRTPLDDPETIRLASELAMEHGIQQRADIGEQEIIERLLYPLINEGVKILEDGIAYRPGDIDVVWTSGYGFPKHLGGPLYFADQIGLTVLVERLNSYAERNGNCYGYWTISPLLRELASTSRRLSDWKPTHCA